ncbi:MAG: flagellar motor switch protein FliM [Burkholderiales bacterium]|nr:flagellar motor switch protein FliM [Burkholderiales bacterium]
MANNLLSPEEMSALTEGVNDGSIAVDTGFNTAARVKKHDLATENSNLGVNVSSIDMINERFIRLFRLSLMEVLRTSPRINSTKVQIVRFGDYIKGLNAPLSVNVVRMNPLRGYSLVVIDPSIVFSSLVSFFGGFGSGAVGNLSPGRMFTPTETRIIKMILDVSFRTLKDAWSPLLGIDFELVSSEINPQFAQIADENDLVVVSRFETEGTAKTLGFIDFVNPYASLKPVRELLSSRVQTGEGNEESDKQWYDQLDSAVSEACLQASVIFGTLPITLRQLEAMQVGDVLHFKKPDLASMNVNGIHAFDVHVGSLGTQTAVQIERAVVPGAQ